MLCSSLPWRDMAESFNRIWNRDYSVLLNELFYIQRTSYNQDFALFTFSNFNYNGTNFLEVVWLFCYKLVYLS